jgi:RNA polymerase sigma-70 factor (ECF subfamily)
MPIDANTSSDVEIVRQVVDGDVNAFELLLKRYQDHVLKIVKKHVPYEQIEETAHDVFVRAYQSLPTFKNKSYFKHWLSSIAVRTCCDFWRKQYRSRELPMSSLSEKQQHWLETTISDHSSRSFYEQGVQQEAKDVLDWALSTLSAEDRMVMELVYLEGLSGKEAAKLLGWSVANVKVRAFRCRKKLQKLLMKEFNRKSSQNLSDLEHLDSPLEGGKGGVNSV